MLVREADDVRDKDCHCDTTLRAHSVYTNQRIQADLGAVA